MRHLPDPLAKLPDGVRTVVRDEAQLVGQELKAVRRPRDVRRILKDPGTLHRMSEPLEPALDRIATVVARGTVPLPPKVATGLVAATGLAGAGVGSALQLFALLGVEAPPVALTAAGASGVVAVAAELVEFYVVACVVRDGLRAAGLDEPALFRQALVDAYLGDDDGGAPTDAARHSWSRRMARAVFRRALPRMAPVIGVPIAARSSVRDLRRARAVVARMTKAAQTTQITGPAQITGAAQITGPG